MEKENEEMPVEDDDDFDQDDFDQEDFEEAEEEVK